MLHTEALCLLSCLLPAATAGMASLATASAHSLAPRPRGLTGKGAGKGEAGFHGLLRGPAPGRWVTLPECCAVGFPGGFSLQARARIFHTHHEWLGVT